MTIAICIGCGCDDLHACWDETAEQPCSWLRLNRDIGKGVCSCCPSQIARYDAGDLRIDVPTNHESA